jgi:pyruvate/2-oxoglutarate dehydrogenase complex dihydrolipoamide acyltransferase (E2) component
MDNVNNRQATVLLILLAGLLFAGCGGGPDVAAVSNDAAEPPAAAATSTAPPAPAPPPPAAPKMPTVTPAAPVEKAAEPEVKMDREKAVAGVGKKGRGYGGGIVSEPVRLYFGTRQRIVFQIRIPDALRTYKAMNDGKGPASHEIFMEEIVAKNSLPLPELPEGDSYYYDVEKEELMVQRPE